MSSPGFGKGAGAAASPAPETSNDNVRLVRVWDPVVRLFHWSLVFAFLLAWVSGEDLQALHQTAGYTIAGLLALRIIWGFAGTRHARFSDFVYKPSTVLRYVRNSARLRPDRYVGHNPAGGWMVVAMLLVLALLCASGTAMTVGPYQQFEWLEEAHEALANLSLLLVGLHLTGVMASSWMHRENLVRAMVTGRKRRA